MSKRGSGVQITKDDDVDRLAEGNDEGSFEDQKASAEEMKTRKIFVPKRMLSAAGAAAAAPTVAPAPAAAPDASAFPVFKFGSTETPAETNGKSAFPSFNFGASTATTETKTESASTPASSSQSTDSTAAASVESSSAAATSASSTDSAAASTSASSSAFSGFSFGSGGFNFGNATWGKLESFSSIAPSSSSAFSVSSSSSTFQFDNTAPVLKDAPAVVLDEFKNKAPEASGEEDETTVCKVNVRAFVLEKVEKKAEKAEDGTDKKEAASSSSASEEAGATKWAERGRGDVKINKREEGGKTLFRLLMRAEKTHRVVINAPLLSNFKFTPENEKFIRFASVDQDLKPVAYLLKFTSKDDFRTFSTGLTDAVAQLQGAEKTA